MLNSGYKIFHHSNSPEMKAKNIIINVLIISTVFLSMVHCTKKDNDILTVETQLVDSIRLTSARITSKVTDKGGSGVTVKGICWSTQSDPVITNHNLPAGPGEGSFVSIMTGLEEDITYFVRAYASNNHGIIYGNGISFTIENPNINWISGIDWIDVRDWQSYGTVQIGDQIWMSDNLNYGKIIDSGKEHANNGVVEKYCYNDNPSNCEKFGGLYTWDETMNYDTIEGIQGICPEGWHLPTEQEWVTLFRYLGNEDGYGVAIKLKEAGSVNWNSFNQGTNESGFTALGAGSWFQHSVFRGYEFTGTHNSTLFWASTDTLIDRGEMTTPRFADHAYYIYIESFDHQAVLCHGDKMSGFSVRCIKN